jgi:tRNA G10  N-methylase Trm11
MLGVSDVDFARLGGSTRLARVLTEIPSTNWKDVENYLIKTVPEHLQYLRDGKLQLGLSTFGFSISPAKLTATGLTLKKVIRNAGRSVRLVPNQTNELNTAQVLHNHLTGPLGWELLLIKTQHSTVLAQTVAVQDIDSYTLRDRGRPKRDARVGMLPPKLAQIIINLAVGEVSSWPALLDSPAQTTRPTTRLPDYPTTILDPFCGTGVVLQEALLMGYSAYGTDLEPRMIAYSEANLDWLTAKYQILDTKYSLQAADATNHQWQISKFQTPNSKVVVACETYLGRPFTERPSSAILAQTISEVNLILKRFLQNIQPQLPQGSRLCLAVPCWFDGREQKHLPFLEHISGMGFERVAFQRASNEDLIYHREGQIVGRELVTLRST